MSSKTCRNCDTNAHGSLIMYEWMNSKPGWYDTYCLDRQTIDRISEQSKRKCAFHLCSFALEESIKEKTKGMLLETGLCLRQLSATLLNKTKVPSSLSVQNVIFGELSHAKLFHRLDLTLTRFRCVHGYTSSRVRKSGYAYCTCP